MKKLILILTIALSSSFAFAGEPALDLTEGEPVLTQPTGVPGLPDPSRLPAYRLFSPATSIAFSTKSLCPEEALRCTVNGTSVEVAYQVDCDQQLVNFNYETITVGDEIHLFTSATLAENPRPANSARCLGTSVQRKFITLPLQYGEVVLHELGKVEDSVE